MSGSGNARRSEFAVPELSPAFIERPHLLRRLDEVMSRPLLSLTGPAGTGKSVLAAQWSRQSGLPVAWMRLDHDEDPDTLFMDVLRALHHVTGTVPPVDDDTQLAVRGDRPDPAAIDRLAAVVADSPPGVIVLDGMRASGPLGVYADLTLALDRSPGCEVHLLAVSRCTLPTQLNPLALGGVLPHVGATDLALDVVETAAVVETHSGRPIDAATAAELTERLDGWMAGTAIAALTRPAGDDASVDELVDAGSDGLEDYVVAEILDHLPDDIRSFLRETSVVDHVTASLCDHLTGRDDSDNVLRTMRRHGLPIHRARSGVGTFRYYGWFRMVLQFRHRRGGATGMSRSLRLASGWFESNERPLEAAECFARLRDWDELERVLTAQLDTFLDAADVDRLARLLALVPRHARRSHVQLGLDAACVEMMAGRVSAAFEELALSRAWMNPEQSMRADVIRAASVAWVEDPLVPLAAAESAIAACDELGDDHSFGGGQVPVTADLFRTSARSSALMAAAYAGRWEDGRRHLVDHSPDPASDLRPVLMLRRLVTRAVFLVLAGDLAAASAEAEAGLSVATERNLLQHPFCGGVFFTLGEVGRLTGTPEEAMPALERGLELVRVNRRRNLLAVATGSLAGLLVDLGRAPEALALLDQYRSARRHRPPTTAAAMLAAGEARALVAIGDHRNALKLLRQAPRTSATAAVHVATALGVGDVAGARDTIGRWPTEKTALSSLRRGLALAMTLDTMGGTRESHDALRSALASAGDQLVQPIAEFGAPMARLLRRVTRLERDTAASDVAHHAQVLIASRGSVAPRLTAREAEVLAHLDRGLSLPAVANETHLSVNTIKTHVKAIYRKLGASSRAEALEFWRAALPTDRPD